MDDGPRNKQTPITAKGSAVSLAAGDRLFHAVGWPGTPFLRPAGPRIPEARTIGKRESYQRDLQARLDAWEVDIHAARVNADKAQAGARPGADQPVALPDRIVELQTTLNAAKEQLKALQQTGQDQWESHQEAIEKTCDELGDAMNSGNVRSR